MLGTTLLWLYKPIIIISFCLCLWYRYFTKWNLLVWIFTLLINPFFCSLFVNLFPSVKWDGRYLFTSGFIAAIMLLYFYGARENTPRKEAFWFTVFAASSFPIFDFIVGGILITTGYLH